MYMNKLVLSQWIVYFQSSINLFVFHPHLMICYFLPVFSFSLLDYLIYLHVCARVLFSLSLFYVLIYLFFRWTNVLTGTRVYASESTFCASSSSARLEFKLKIYCPCYKKIDKNTCSSILNLFTHIPSNGSIPSNRLVYQSCSISTLTWACCPLFYGLWYRWLQNHCHSILG